MLSLITRAFLLSLDSFIATLAVGPLVKSRFSRVHLALWFGFWDGAATFIGAKFDWGGWGHELSHWVVPLAALLYGISFVFAAARKGFGSSPRFAFVLPFLMSFDNLTYGASIGPVTTQVVERAVVLGIASFSMAVLGLLPGSLLRFPSERARQYSTGFGLFAASVVIFVS
jgi:manganese efflux pump family protein